jgi:hypothetical protein
MDLIRFYATAPEPAKQAIDAISWSTVQLPKAENVVPFAIPSTVESLESSEKLIEDIRRLAKDIELERLARTREVQGHQLPLPYSEDAEMGVLRVITLSHSARLEALRECTSEWFYLPQWSALFDTPAVLYLDSERPRTLSFAFLPSLLAPPASASSAITIEFPIPTSIEGVAVQHALTSWTPFE